ncbi:hypothetical protein [Enterococcus faecalis]|uniref:hypothetical protein n=1 Tax=Enterococcus faecalis TaxID=1351 RepID=UPI00338EA765
MEKMKSLSLGNSQISVKKICEMMDRTSEEKGLGKSANRLFPNPSNDNPLNKSNSFGNKP